LLLVGLLKIMLEIVTYLDKIPPPKTIQKIGYEIFLLSCKKFNIKPIILKAGEHEKWNGLITRIIKYKEYIFNHKNDSNYLLIVDCFDLLFVDSPLKILNYEFKDDTILFSSEINCYPNTNLIKAYPNCNTKFKYLNGGIIFGKIKNFKNFFSKIDLYNPNPIFIDEKYGTENDQYIFTKAFLNQVSDIKLDTNCEYFQNLYLTEESDFKFIGNGKILNVNTNTYPFIFHFNGASKYNLIFYKKILQHCII